MLMTDVIVKKREGEKLSAEEIKFVVDGYTKGEIPDYQMSALLMAILLRGHGQGGDAGAYHGHARLGRNA